MKTNKLVFGAGALAVLAGVTLAFQFGSVPQQNIIEKRLEGKWSVNTELTAKLDPAPGSVAPRQIDFVKDMSILKLISAAYPRFNYSDAYIAGLAGLNGERHWFAVLNQDGNSHLVLFNPSREDPVKDPHHVHISLIVSRDQTKDLLFLGGDMARESAVAYDRMGK